MSDTTDFIVDLLSSTEYGKVYAFGAQSFQEGRDITQNPYSEYDERHEWWKDGFIDERDEWYDTELKVF